MDKLKRDRTIKTVLVAAGVLLAAYLAAGFLLGRTLFLPMIKVIEDLSAQPEPKK